MNDTQKNEQNKNKEKKRRQEERNKNTSRPIFIRLQVTEIVPTYPSVIMTPRTVEAVILSEHHSLSVDRCASCCYLVFPVHIHGLVSSYELFFLVL